MSQQDTSGKLRPARNHRSCRRLPSKNTTRARVYRNAIGVGPNLALQVLDLSESGVRLLLKEEIGVGTEFEITLDGVAHKGVRLLARIAWAFATAEGQFVVGASFEKQMNYGALQAMARS